MELVTIRIRDVPAEEPGKSTIKLTIKSYPNGFSPNGGAHLTPAQQAAAVMIDALKKHLGVK